MPPPDQIRIAAAQYPIDALATLGDWSAKVADWIAKGSATGAELLVFPEYGLMELAAPAGREVAGDLARSLAAVADATPAAEAVYARLAREHGVYVLGASGPARRAGGHVNACRLYSPSGASGLVEKLVMTPFEHGWGISAGSGQRVFDTALGRVGVAICYDSEFPLLVRALAEAGAELILIPSCTERHSGYSRVRTAALARALESQIATAVSPTVGEAAWSPAVDRNTGAAGIYAPAEAMISDTGVLAEGVLDAPQWVVADIDLAKMRRVRTAGEMRNSADWARQIGAVPLSAHVEIVALP
jgi:predicted amidohydrolase